MFAASDGHTVHIIFLYRKYTVQALYRKIWCILCLSEAANITSFPIQENPVHSVSVRSREQNQLLLYRAYTGSFLYKNILCTVCPSEAANIMSFPIQENSVHSVSVRSREPNMHSYIGKSSAQCICQKPRIEPASRIQKYSVHSVSVRSREQCVCIIRFSWRSV